MTERATAVRRGLTVSYVTIAWSAVAGVAAAVTAGGDGSVALAGLGINVLVDMGGSIGLVWRFHAERRHERHAERHEEVAERVVAVALVALALWLTVQAVIGLVSGAHPRSSVAGLAIAAASVVVLPPLSVWKRRVAAAVPSRALRADAQITLIGAVMAGATLVGLVANRVAGAWWADYAAALVLAGATGREAWLTINDLRAARSRTSRPG